MAGAYLKLRELELLGRKRIYTDADEITPDNIFGVLESAWAIHEINLEEILFLIRYEKGMQPLKRKKRAAHKGRFLLYSFPFLTLPEQSEPVNTFCRISVIFLSF